MVKKRDMGLFGVRKKIWDFGSVILPARLCSHVIFLSTASDLRVDYESVCVCVGVTLNVSLNKGK